MFRLLCLCLGAERLVMKIAICVSNQYFYHIAKIDAICKEPMSFSGPPEFGVFLPLS